MNRRTRYTLLLAASMLAVSRHGWSDTRTAAIRPPADKPEQALPENPGDSASETHRLLLDSLVAGGCRDHAALQRYEAMLDAFCAQQQAALAELPTDGERATLLLCAMQQRFLTGSFQPHCYRLDDTLDGQSYNCLTSTILFMHLCRSFGLPATAVAGPTHVYCRLHLREPRDVHTNVPVGSAGHGAPSQDRCLPGVVGQDLERELDDHQLQARVYYNRGTSLLVQQEPGRAFPILQRSYQLDPHDPSIRHNLIAAGNEWSLQLCDQERFAESAAVLQSCLALAPQDPATLDNDVHVHHQWVTTLCDRQQFRDALNILERCYVRRPQAIFFDEGRWAVYQCWAASHARSGRWIEAHNVWALAAEQHPHSQDLRSQTAAFWSSYGEPLQQPRRPAEGIGPGHPTWTVERDLTRPDL